MFFLIFLHFLLRKIFTLFFWYLRIKLENNNYKVYTQKNEYKYKDEVKKVQENEELIAIKEKWECK